jgi:Zn-dependent protease/CBS domain-containing protein
VLLHELSHSLVAHAYGLRVHGITLHVFGGVSHLEDESPSPRAEFWIAIAGPLASFGLAAVVWGLSALPAVPAGSGRALLIYLVVTNVAVGVFNLVPGFPLDGGRVLRAVLWRWTGSVNRATRIAARIGGGFALTMVALGALEILKGAFISGVWLVLLGLFLRGAAEAGSAQVALRQALGQLKVREVMSRRVVTVAPQATLAELVEQAWRHHFTSFPVVDGGRVTGVATIHQVEGVPREQWMQARAEDVMQPLTDDMIARPDDEVQQALQKASGNRLGRVAVLDGYRLVGYLSMRDIAHVLTLKGLADPDLADARRAA